MTHDDSPADLEVHHLDLHEAFYLASHLNEIYVDETSPFGSEPPVPPVSTALKTARPASSDYESLRPYFLRAPAAKVKATFDHTTQFDVGIVQGKTIKQISALLDWKPHSVRAALTRLRARGYLIERIPKTKTSAAKFGIQRTS